MSRKGGRSTFQKNEKQRSFLFSRNKKRLGDDRQDGGRSFICSRAAALGGPRRVTSVAETSSAPAATAQEAVLVSE